MRIQSTLLTFTHSTRSFIFMTMAITSPYYLSSFHYSAIEIGFVLFLSLLSSSIFVFLYSRINSTLKIRSVILSALLIVGFLILIILNNPIFYVMGIIIGAISLSGRDLSAYQPIEQYTISHYETEQRSKNMAFSIYNFGSYGAASIGSLLLYTYTSLSFHELFIIDLLLAVVQMVIYLSVTFPYYEKKRVNGEISKDMKGHIRNLTLLFSMDSLGGGLVTTSMLTLWFKVVYNIDLSTAGFIFLIVNILTAVSILISSRIQNSIGLIKTMVFTHIISNGFLILMPVLHSLIWSEGFLYLRQTTSQMDVPARDSFINTFIPKESRIGANSVFTSARSASQIPGPVMGGLAIEFLPTSLLFVAGGIKGLYDILLYWKYSWFKE